MGPKQQWCHSDSHRWGMGSLWPGCWVPLLLCCGAGERHHLSLWWIWVRRGNGTHWCGSDWQVGMETGRAGGQEGTYPRQGGRHAGRPKAGTLVIEPCWREGHCEESSTGNTVWDWSARLTQKHWPRSIHSIWENRKQVYTRSQKWTRDQGKTCLFYAGFFFLKFKNYFY